MTATSEAARTGRRTQPRFHTLTVAAVDRLTDDAVAVTLAVPDGLRDVFGFAAGQHLTVRRLVDGVVQGRATATRSTVVRMGRPTDRELDAYIATGEPLGVAGALTIDGFGGWFVEGVDGDPSNVLGVSLPLVRELLAEVGVAVTDLWRIP